jgi:hypothetical protein
MRIGRRWLPLSQPKYPARAAPPDQPSSKRELREQVKLPTEAVICPVSDDAIVCFNLAVKRAADSGRVAVMYRPDGSYRGWACPGETPCEPAQKPPSTWFEPGPLPSGASATPAASLARQLAAAPLRKPPTVPDGAGAPPTASIVRQQPATSTPLERTGPSRKPLTSNGKMVLVAPGTGEHITTSTDGVPGLLGQGYQLATREDVEAHNRKIVLGR